ncbi:aminotransferase class III-fold pyridoxal phosphate-dependent enzyme [Allorhodopirellula solitaria]|uniref:Acetylornithine aminotransferase n=1 Tax=Allorhodopirellula solitaria TaxID=2527987 RepID=A0A5C5WYP0_9BACT|nr:aminotransferase class III-fold pyridoxal phosphate-dependent enzyme [Allorhodopirellula solitaria]TWT55710.1 Acetylornithine aminotransferase [Allorhodopirellula solitaria]
MSEIQDSLPWIDALAGTISATGADCPYLATASSQWTQRQWQAAEGDATDATAANIAEHLRALTELDEDSIASCLVSASQEELLQWALVLCRLQHQAVHGSSSATDASTAFSSRCLAAVGSDHGDGILGQMASGRADGRSAQWPLVPGFTHAALESLAERIDDSIAMVLVSPIDVHDMMKPVTQDQLLGIAAACQRAGACLVIDHRHIPPQGGGGFWLHDAIASITADAVIMSAGLMGGTPGGLLTLNASLAKHVPSLLPSDSELPRHTWAAALVSETLQQWIDQSWREVQTDELATELAGRLANHQCVRDLHLTGRTIGIELDIPAAQWVNSAADHQLGVATAGEFAVAMQPPLVISSAEIATLCDRVDDVFESIAREESDSEGPATAPDEPAAASDVSATEPNDRGLEDASAEPLLAIAEEDSSEEGETDTLIDEQPADQLDESSTPSNHRDTPATPTDPENQP